MKAKIFIIGLVVFHILAIRINFLNFLMGSDASLTNLFISLGFIIYWVVTIFYFRDSKKFLKYSIISSSLTLITILSILLINFYLYDFQFPGLVILLIVFITPWYGIEFIIKNNDALICMITIASAIWTLSSVLLFKRVKF